jgi:hypothetical protein
MQYMNPTLQVHGLQGVLHRNGDQSTCLVTQRVTGEGRAIYYTNALISDASVNPHLDDGEYEFSYPGETNAPVRVTRQDGIWLNVPPSTKTPHQH